MIDLLYYMFHCSSNDNGTNSKHGMAAYGIELIFTQVFVFFSMIFMGVCNIRFDSFIFYVLILLPVPFISYYVINGYYIKSGRYIKILEKHVNTPTRTKTIYKLIVILLFLLSFISLFVGGIIMSYLFSLHE